VLNRARGARVFGFMSASRPVLTLSTAWFLVSPCHAPSAALSLQAFIRRYPEGILPCFTFTPRKITVLAAPSFRPHKPGIHMETSVKASKQEQWQELVSRVQELASATSDENARLVQKVKDLEVEVTVWKQALSTARGTQDRESESTVTSAASQKGVALCVIDGTRSIFSPNYITQGQEGGRGAGREIIRGITDHLVHRSIQDMNPKLAIIVYVRKAQLQHDLVGSNNCTSEQFDDFFVGLNETPYINIVEVSSKRDADKKIEEHLQLFAGLTQTVRIFFSGGMGQNTCPSSLPSTSAVPPASWLSCEATAAHLSARLPASLPLCYRGYL